MGDRRSEDLAGPVPLAHGAVTVEDVLFESVWSCGVSALPVRSCWSLRGDHRILHVARARPFDGTDAAVADVNEVEIELQAFVASSPPKIVTPRNVFGFAKRDTPTGARPAT